MPLLEGRIIFQTPVEPLFNDNQNVQFYIRFNGRRWPCGKRFYSDWKCVYDRGPSLCHTSMHSTVSTTPSNINNCLLINGTQWLFKKGLYRSQNCLKSIRGSWGWLSVLSLYIYYQSWASHLSGDLFMWEMPRYIIFWDATMMCQKDVCYDGHTII